MSVLSLLGSGPSGSAVDADAQAFFDAAGITDATQKSAVNQLVLTLKSNSLWSGMSAIYPFVGGTAGTHKWNLKDPRDLDAAFRLSFSGGWTHDSNGVTPNGSTGYADTFIVPSSHLLQDNKHLSAYIRTNLDNCLVGTVNVAGTLADQLLYSAGILGNLSSNGSGTAHTVDKRLYCVTRTGSSTATTYRDGSSIYSDGLTSSGQADLSLYVGARHWTTTGLYSNANLAFVSIGAGLSAGDVTNLTNAVNSYQTTLGRNV